MRSNKGNGLPHRESVYDGKQNGWTRIDHGSPDELLAFKLLSAPPAADMQTVLDEMAAAAGLVSVQHVRKQMRGSRPHENVWKTLVRYVWHNAKSATGACIYFGIAARSIDERFERRMLPAEVDALKAEGTFKWNRACKLFKFRDRAVFRKMQPMTGYTPLSALLEGENGEYRDNDEAQEKRRMALRVIFRAAWQDIDPGEGKPYGRWEKTLRNAFKNFTALTAEDRDLLAWITQTEFAYAFKETRAAMCARRKRKVRTTLELNGCTAVTAPGGKSESAIGTYKTVQKGNHNRAGGQCPFHKTTLARDEHAETLVALREHDGVPILNPILAAMSPKELRAHLRSLAMQAEARRLAALCGVSPEDIVIDKTTPTA